MVSLGHSVLSLVLALLVLPKGSEGSTFSFPYSAVVGREQRILPAFAIEIGLPESVVSQSATLQISHAEFGSSVFRFGDSAIGTTQVYNFPENLFAVGHEEVGFGPHWHAMRFPLHFLLVY